MGRNRRRIYALVSVIAVVGASLAVAPALGDDHVRPPDAVSFEANHPEGPRFTHPDFVVDQILTTETKPNTCKLAPEGPQLLALTGIGGPVGMTDLGIGVRTSGSNANGTPCSQVDSNETLEIAPGSALGGKWFSRVELDLELTGNAIVEMTLWVGNTRTDFKLYTGTNLSTLCDGTPTAPGCEDENPPRPHVVDSGDKPDSACSSPQNSGPKSSVNDNCIWKVDPGFAFDKISITTSVGTVSLEGGSETGFHSKFFLADSTPVARPDEAFIRRGADYIDINVLLNDSPSSPKPVIYNPSSINPLKGTIDGIFEVDGVQHIRYRPNTDPIAGQVFDGSDEFTYQLVDGTGPTALVSVYELFDCEDPLEVEKLGVTASYERIPSDGCPDKSYELDVITTNEGEGDTARDLPTVLFKPRHGDNPDCSLVPRPEGCTELFKGTLTFAPRLAENGAVNSGELQYDPKDDEVEVFRPVLWCKVNPFAGYDPALLNPYPNLPANPDDVLPAGESWCIAYETTVPMSEVESYVGPQRTQTTWVVYGIGDPLKRVS